MYVHRAQIISYTGFFIEGFICFFIFSFALRLRRTSCSPLPCRDNISLVIIFLLHFNILLLSLAIIPSCVYTSFSLIRRRSAEPDPLIYAKLRCCCFLTRQFVSLVILLISSRVFVCACVCVCFVSLLHEKNEQTGICVKLFIVNESASCCELRETKVYIQTNGKSKKKTRGICSSEFIRLYRADLIHNRSS